jgi:hypothetical protein
MRKSEVEKVAKYLYEKTGSEAVNRVRQVAIKALFTRANEVERAAFRALARFFLANGRKDAIRKILKGKP